MPLTDQDKALFALARKHISPALAQNAFYLGAQRALQALAHMLEHGDVEELHRVIERHGRRIRAIRKPPPLRH